MVNPTVTGSYRIPKKFKLISECQILVICYYNLMLVLALKSRPISINL
jgi:hypothetical protein